MKISAIKFANLKTKPKILIGICSPLVLLMMLGGISVYSISSIVTTNESVDHTYVVLGDAAAHSRSPAISSYVKQNALGEIKFSDVGRMPKPRNRVLLVLEPFACVLGASIMIIERFHLDRSLMDRADRLRQRWDTLVVSK